MGTETEYSAGLKPQVEPREEPIDSHSPIKGHQLAQNLVFAFKWAK